MRAVEITAPGAPDVLRVCDRPDPIPGPGEVLIQVAAAGVNRPDVLQRQGAYPPPPGASDLPGLEVAGRVQAVGPGVDGWRVGDRVCALVSGGGYASLCVAPAPQCLPVPGRLNWIQAAAVPETFFTVWTNLFDRGRLAAGETVLIHGGASGIGTTAIQLARAWGARVLVTAGGPDKCRACERLGAERAIDYRTEDFVAVVKSVTGARGVDVILDIRRVLGRRLTITGSTLRPRTVAEKGAIADALRRRVWPWLEAGTVAPVIYRAMPLTEAAAAHRMMEASEHVGKIVLTVDPDI
jgi:putative PIG3 family NAD(P)H quinone oxidoreductase